MMLERICVLIIITSVAYGDEVLMEERTFCGDNILRTLQKFCKVYYTPGKSRMILYA